MTLLQKPIPAAATDDHLVKKARLLSLLQSRDADALLLTGQPALAWYLDGARTHVNAGAPPIVAVRVSVDADEVLLTSNEADRLVAEELPDWATVHAVEWHEPLPTGIGGRVLGESEVEAELRAVRSPLLPSEISRFEELGSEAAAVLTDVLQHCCPEQTERSLAATITGRVAALGADPLVVLVGGAGRRAYRHPLPTEAPLGRRAMVVLCARRHGLIANLSRWVSFGEPTEAEHDADTRILGVESEFFAALQPGRALGEVFSLGCAGYGRFGFDPQEWRRHHQGGVAGYAGRDPRATPGVTDRVVDRQAFAWNPTALGCKVEDTVLYEGGRIRALTVDPNWPTVEVEGRARPDVLVH